MKKFEAQISPNKFHLDPIPFSASIYSTMLEFENSYSG